MSAQCNPFLTVIPPYSVWHESRKKLERFCAGHRLGILASHRSNALLQKCHVGWRSGMLMTKKKSKKAYDHVIHVNAKPKMWTLKSCLLSQTNIRCPLSRRPAEILPWWRFLSSSLPLLRSTKYHHNSIAGASDKCCPRALPEKSATLFVGIHTVLACVIDVISNVITNIYSTNISTNMSWIKIFSAESLSTYGKGISCL